MYKVLIDGEILSWYALEETALVSATLTLEANKAGTFVFSMPPSHPFYSAIVFRQSLIDVYQDADLIFEGVPVTESTDFDNVKTVTCEGELTFLNDTIQRPAKYTSQTVSALLTAYLTKHNADCDASKTFSVGMVTVGSGASLDRYTNYESTMQEIAEDLVNDLGGYLRVRHHQGVRYLDYLAASPHTSSQIIKIGQNLLDFSKNYDSADICTVLIPLGATIRGQQTTAWTSRASTAASTTSSARPPAFTAMFGERYRSTASAILRHCSRPRRPTSRTRNGRIWSSRRPLWISGSSGKMSNSSACSIRSAWYRRLTTSIGISS